MGESNVGVLSELWIEEFLGHASEPIDSLEPPSFTFPPQHRLCLERKSSSGYVVSFQ